MGRKHEMAFQTLKQTLSEIPILSIPDPTQTFDIYVDASDLALGAVLEQNKRPISFASRSLNIHEQKLAQALYFDGQKRHRNSHQRIFFM